MMPGCRIEVTNNIMAIVGENLARSLRPHHKSSARGAFGAEVTETEILLADRSRADLCCECKGTGVVIHLNEVAYFEDRRSCKRCGAGLELDARIADIIDQAHVREQLAR